MHDIDRTGMITAPGLRAFGALPPSLAVTAAARAAISAEMADCAAAAETPVHSNGAGAAPDSADAAPLPAIVLSGVPTHSARSVGANADALAIVTDTFQFAEAAVLRVLATERAAATPKHSSVTRTQSIDLGCDGVAVGGGGGGQSPNRGAELFGGGSSGSVGSNGSVGSVRQRRDSRPEVPAPGRPFAFTATSDTETISAAYHLVKNSIEARGLEQTLERMRPALLVAQRKRPQGARAEKK
jgi:hypothetical protein